MLSMCYPKRISDTKSEEERERTGGKGERGGERKGKKKTWPGYISRQLLTTQFPGDALPVVVIAALHRCNGIRRTRVSRLVGIRSHSLARSLVHGRRRRAIVYASL